MKILQSHVADPQQQTNVPDALAVWIIEDDPLFRETVERLLMHAGSSGTDHTRSPSPDAAFSRAEFKASTLAFGSCEEALACGEQGAVPDVVLMDIELPGMSGIDGIRRLNALAPMAHIVMLTVHEDQDRIFEAICAGASGYLLKPSSAGQIIDAVQSARRGGAPINPQIASKVLRMFAGLAVPKGEYGLTDREREVLEELVRGRTKKRIADALSVSFHTVDMHVRNIYAKLHVHSRSGAVAKALKERLV